MATLSSSPTSTILAGVAVSPLLFDRHNDGDHNTNDDSAADVSCGMQHHHDKAEKNSISLQEFLQKLPNVIRDRKKKFQENPTASQEDPIKDLFQRVDLQESDWKPYCYFDEYKHYTRNLIATDNETYTLLLLCWQPGRSSPIHDHPCDGCWMRVLQGEIRESRYERPLGNAGAAPLVCFQDESFHVNDGIVFIEDSMGLHKVGNNDPTIPAVTLHLYSPPFQICQIWLDESRDKPCKSSMCNYSEYGEVL